MDRVIVPHSMVLPELRRRVNRDATPSVGIVLIASENLYSLPQKVGRKVPERYPPKERCA
jgi:hypothetical protein